MPERHTIDINCDLGEGEPIARTRALMRLIGSANIACGGHAGTAASMRACVRLAQRCNVKIGAHPGGWSREDRGRGVVAIAPDELRVLVLHQVGALDAIARREGAALHHVKLHGALYHAAEHEPRLARAYLECIAAHWPAMKVYALAGGRVLREARRLGVPSLSEAFADRAYRADGQLVSRDIPGSVLQDVSVVAARARDLAAGRGLTTIEGLRLDIHAETLCVHADTPNAIRFTRTVAQMVSGARR